MGCTNNQLTRENIIYEINNIAMLKLMTTIKMTRKILVNKEKSQLLY